MCIPVVGGLDVDLVVAFHAVQRHTLQIRERNVQSDAAQTRQLSTIQPRAGKAQDKCETPYPKMPSLVITSLSLNSVAMATSVSNPLPPIFEAFRILISDHYKIGSEIPPPLACPYTHRQCRQGR